MMIGCEELFQERCCQDTSIRSPFPGELLNGDMELWRRSRHFVDFEQTRCNQHNGEERRMFCLECQEMVCVRCLLEGHQSHLWSSVEEMLIQFRKCELDPSTVSSCLSRGAEQRQALSEERSNFLRQLEATETAVVEKNQELKDLIDRHTADILEELSQVKMMKLADIEKSKQEIDKQLKMLEICCTDWTGKPLVVKELFKAMNAVSHNAGEGMSTAATDSRTCGNIAGLVDFQQSEVIEKLTQSGNNIVGRLKAEFGFRDESSVKAAASARSENKQKSEANHVALQLTQLLDTDGFCVFGVAAMRNSLYILLSNSILVYDNEPPFDRVGEIKAPQFLYPFDMAACPVTPSLYVTDDGYRCVWKVDGDQLVTRWLEGTGDPSTISVANGGKVLMVRCGQPSSVEIYTHKAELSSRFQLPDDVTEPQHAVSTSNGDVVVCFLQKSRVSWGFCQLNIEGHLIARCDFVDDLPYMAGTPSHLAVDGQDRVFVADWQNKIDLYDSQLNWDRVLLSATDHGLQRPERMCYDRESGLLVLVHGWGKKTYVYQYFRR